jgi:hypothetical protein
MRKTLCSVIAAVSMALGVLSTATEVRAQAAPPPTSCTITIGSNQVAVTTPSTFPEPVSCPAAPGFGSDCLKWSYTFTRTGGNVDHAGTTVDSDVTPIVATVGGGETETPAVIGAPGAGDTVLNLAKGVQDVRVVRYSPSPASQIVGNVYTSASARVGTVSAAARVGFAINSCAIAGPDNIVPAAGKIALTTRVIDQVGQCTIERTLDAGGCTVEINVLQAPDGVTCSVDSEPRDATLGGTGETLSGAECTNKITFGSNTRYCYTGTTGRLTCVSVTP